MQTASLIFLTNERVLNTQEKDAEWNARTKVMDFLNIEIGSPQSLRQSVEKKSRFSKVKLNPSWRSENRFSIKNTKFDRQDSWWNPDRTMNSYDCNESLFELSEGRTEYLYNSFAGQEFIQQ